MIRGEKYGKATMNMTDVEKSLITGTDRKRFEGIFELDMKFWVRQYNFT